MQNILYFIKKHVKDIIIVCLLIVLIIVVAVKYIIKNDEKQFSDNLPLADPVVLENTESSSEDESKIYVDIKGAVKKPGVYEVNKNSIVNDVISLAGGINANAYKNGINLSKKVTDEMVLYIYTKEEIKNSKIDADNICTTPTYNICECINENASIIKPGVSSTSSTNSLNDKTDQNTSVNGKVNINTATINELTSLSGIGESKAKSIIEYREANGLFKSIEELKNVSGIGDSVFEKIKNNITI